MGTFTLTNLSSVDDSAAAFGFGDFQESRFATRALACEQTGLALHRIKAGQRSPISHRHRAQEELYVVVAGSGRAKLDDELVDLSARDALRVAPNVTRGFEAGPDGLELLAFGATIADGDERDQGEMVDDHWA